MIVLLINPAAGRGRAAAVADAARRAFATVGCADVRVTERAGDESRLARAALDDGCTTLAVLGGDGTVGHVARVLAGTGCRLGIVPAGTGNDFAKSVGASRDPTVAARRAAGGADRVVDMGRVGDDPFLNAAGFGFDAAVIARTQRPTRLRGDAVYVAAALRELLAYRGFSAALDGAPFAPHLLLVFANGARFGGAFRIAPAARVDDGRLDAVSVGDAGALRRVRLLGAAAAGAHARYPEVAMRTAESFSVRFAAPPVYQADGELRRAASAEVEVACVPRALRVMTGG
jgi:diacylglycerol kinase (ATP)